MDVRIVGVGFTEPSRIITSVCAAGTVGRGEIEMSVETLLRFRKWSKVTSFFRGLAGALFIIFAYVWPFILTAIEVNSIIMSAQPLPPNTIPNLPMSVFYPLFAYPIIGLFCVFVEGLAELPLVLGDRIMGPKFLED